MRLTDSGWRILSYTTWIAGVWLLLVGVTCVGTQVDDLASVRFAVGMAFIMIGLGLGLASFWI